MVERTFTEIFEKNGWRGRESVSGKGSDLENTRHLVSLLPQLFDELEIVTLLDIPCGDFNWMRTVELGDVRYLGGDIVKKLIEKNKQHERAGIQFRHLDLIADDLPKVDLIFCRDCLVHFSFAHAFLALANMRKSGSTYLLTTTFPQKRKNEDIETGAWHALNLQVSPFCLPPTLRTIVEGYEREPDYADKSLALWRLADLENQIEAVPNR